MKPLNVIFQAALLWVTLGWDPSPDTNVTGFKIYQGSESRLYTNVVDAGFTTECTVSNLLLVAPYFFAATAYTGDNLESDFSIELSYIPVRITDLTIETIP